MVKIKSLKTLIITDPTNDYISEFEIIELGQVGIMSRNSPCFCGSSKKIKHCHSDINENSIIAELLRVYKKIDERNAHAKSLCNKGCADCCTNDFQVQLWEFFCILEYLGIGSYKMAKSREKLARQLIQLSLETAQTCIFLDQQEKACKIYEVRPAVCRNYGQTLQATEMPCEPLKQQSSNINLVDENDFEPLDSVGILTYKNQRLVSKSKTMTLWFRENLDNNCNVRPQLMRELFATAMKGTQHQFAELLLNRGAKISAKDVFVE